MSDPLDLVEQMKLQEAQYLEQTSFKDCAELRDIGLFLAGGKFDDPADVRSAVMDEFDLREEAAEHRILQYVSLIAAPKEKIGGTAVEQGVKYFSGVSIDEIARNTRYSQGEIRRQLRLFVSQCEERTAQPLEFKTNFPPVESLKKDYGMAIANTISDIEFDALTDIDRPEIDRSEYPFSWLQFLPVDAYDELYEIYEESGESKVQQILANTLDETDIHGYVETTKLFTGDREQLYYEALEAYREERYALCIPLTLTQIDGLVIELATELGIWELDNDVTGTQIIDKSTVVQSEKYIDEVDEFLAEYYKRLMGRGTRRAKVLHGIETDFAKDRGFAAELMWFWVSIFYLVDRINSKNTIRDVRLLEFLAVSDPQTLEKIVRRFDSQDLYVKSRLDGLCEDGLLRVEDGLYTITDAGEEHLLDLQPKFIL